jgi:UDP-glucuronate 4-epimerase
MVKQRRSSSLTVMVTGGAGFIGSHLCTRLLSAGHNVVCLDNFDPFYSREIKLTNIADLRRNPHFSFEEVDVRSRDSVSRIFKNGYFDLVYHLAGRGGIPQSTRAPSTYVREIIQGSISVLEECAAQKCRVVVNASSSSVYGETEGSLCSEVGNTDLPNSIYAALKKSSELLCRAYHHLYGLGMVNARFFSVYGPRGRPDQIVYKIVQLIAAGRPVPIVKPEPARDFIYIDDVVDALLRMTRLKRGSYEVVNIGSGKPRPIAALIAAAEIALGKKAVIGGERGPPLSDISSTHADISRANSLLDWKPHTDLETGVRKFVKWYLDQKRSSPGIHAS